MASEMKSIRTKAHIRYKNQAGEIVPGVTTIIGAILAKPQLIIWANRLGLQGIDSTKYRDEKGAIGTLAHAMILADLKGEKVDTDEYSKEQITQAENSYLKWLEWQKGKEFKPVCVETPLVSELHQFGGSPDYLGMINGELILADYKTGFVGKEAYIQTCAYRELLIENGYPPASKIIILGIPRTEDEKFQEIIYTSFDVGWGYFKSLKACYDWDKKIK